MKTPPGDAPLRDHYIVCGMGHVGFRIALLLRRLGLAVAAIHDKTPEDWVREAEHAGVVCFQGDVRNDELLRKAGICAARAIIAATDQDMTNLSVALDSLRLNSGIVTVVRLFDVQLAGYVEESLHTRQVLSASALASPVFADAAFGEDVVGHFTLEGRNYTIVEGDAGCAGHGGEAVPLFTAVEGGVARAEAAGAGSGKMLAICPSPNGARGGEARRRRASRWARGVADLSVAVRGVSLGARILLVCLAAMILLGVFVIHGTMDLSFIDAFYFAVTTVTTTGYGDVSFLHAPTPVKLFGCFLMVSGAALLALLFGLITDAVISHRFQGMLAGVPVRMQGHIVVSGAGHVSFRIMEELVAQGQEVVAVDPELKNAAALRALGVAMVKGDARLESVLRAASVEKARAVMAVDEDDVVNLGVGLLAKKLNASVRTVVRVFDGVLAEKLQKQTAVDRVMSVSAVSAPCFVAACLYERIDQAVVWHDYLLVLRSQPTTDQGAVVPELTVGLGHDPATGRIICTGVPAKASGTGLFLSLHRLSQLP